MEDYFDTYDSIDTSLDEVNQSVLDQHEGESIKWDLDNYNLGIDVKDDETHDGYEICSVIEHTSGHIHNLSFQAREDMLPYEENVNFNTTYGLTDPFALYATKQQGELSLPNDFITKPYLPENFTNEQLQEACNQMCDVLGIRHLPVYVTDSVPNAQFATITGPFRFTLVDDTISFNPDYAEACIEHLGGTDIILSDAAHEIGHAMASINCGKLSTYTNEKLADFISGFLNCKMGVDIDVARQWFQWQYDPLGECGYPVSEERWDIESAGYFFGTMTDAEGLKEALKDPEFLKLIMDYKSETVLPLSVEQWTRMHEDGLGYADSARKMFSNIQKYLLIQRF